MMKFDDGGVECRVIPSCGGFYYAGEDGWIRTLKYRGEVQVLRGCVNGNGYRVVKLRIDGQRAQRAVHQLVLEAFAGPRPEGLQSRHMDGDKLNCRAENLCWGTAKENAEDRLRHGTQLRGEWSGAAKLTEGGAMEVRRRWDCGESGRTIALDFGIAAGTVRSIGARRCWKHLPEEGVLGRVQQRTLAAEQAEAIRVMFAAGTLVRVIARELGTSASTVSATVNNRRYRSAAGMLAPRKRGRPRKKS